jgi:hypothetical protein
LKDKANDLEKFILEQPKTISDYLLQDLPRWIEVTKYKGETPFINIWARRQKFRSEVYYRARIAQSKFTGGVNYRHDMAKVVGQSPGLYVSNLYLSCEEIGPGL